MKPSFPFLLLKHSTLALAYLFLARIVLIGFADWNLVDEGFVSCFRQCEYDFTFFCDTGG